MAQARQWSHNCGGTSGARWGPTGMSVQSDAQLLLRARPVGNTTAALTSLMPFSDEDCTNRLQFSPGSPLPAVPHSDSAQIRLALSASLLPDSNMTVYTHIHSLFTLAYTHYHLYLLL